MFPLAGEGTGSADSGTAWSTVYRQEPRYIVMNRAGLSLPGASVVLLGASNVEVGFSTAALGPLLPQRTVHNLGLGSANVSELGEIVDLAFEPVPAERRKEMTFVIGLWYGLFIDDATRWRGKPTDIDTEMLRYGLYHRSGTGFAPLLPPRFLAFETILFRPLLALDVAIKGSLAPLRRLVEKGEIGHRDLDTVQIDDATKQKMLAFWRAQVGSPDGRLKDEQFEKLLALLHRISEQGARVVLIDLPLPSWHASRSPSFADYQQRKLGVLARASAVPGVTYHNLQDLSNDAEFYDEVHPRPGARWKWFQRLAQVLHEDLPARALKPVSASSS